MWKKVKTKWNKIKWKLIAADTKRSTLALFYALLTFCMAVTRTLGKNWRQVKQETMVFTLSLDTGFLIKCFWSVDVNKSWLSQLKFDRTNNIKPRRTVSALLRTVVVDYPKVNCHFPIIESDFS